MLNVEIVVTFAQNPESPVLGRRPYEAHVANKPPPRSMPLRLVQSAYWPCHGNGVSASGG